MQEDSFDEALRDMLSQLSQVDQDAAQLLGEVSKAEPLIDAMMKIVGTLYRAAQEAGFDNSTALHVAMHYMDTLFLRDFGGAK